MGSSNTAKMVLGLAIGHFLADVVGQVFEDPVAGVHGVSVQDDERNGDLAGSFASGAHDAGFLHPRGD